MDANSSNSIFRHLFPMQLGFLALLLDRINGLS